MAQTYERLFFNVFYSLLSCLLLRDLIGRPRKEPQPSPCGKRATVTEKLQLKWVNECQRQVY